jgi:hypothetical protein
LCLVLQVSASLSANDLFDCVKSEAVWSPFRTSICSNTGVAGAIALSTCICFIFAICLMPGVCIGIIGYKRFDPASFGVKVSDNNKPNSPSKSIKSQQLQYDPYAAGLAERPRYGLASPSAIDPYASPSIAMPSEVEMQPNPALSPSSDARDRTTSHDE